VPKSEIFVTNIFSLSDPIWNFGTEAENPCV
jgi:hypothetical protein